MGTSKPSDRRKSQRFDTTLDIHIRFQSDGTPVDGSCIEIGPNGMRVLSKAPLIEAAYVHVSFQNASNNTYCEGRVVWTERSVDGESYESGIDVQRWGGGIPGADILDNLPALKPKHDRRKKPR